MPSGMVVGAIGGGTSGPGHSLFVNGLDVIHKPGASGNAYYVPTDSIALVENGRGGISSLAFRVEDPLAEITIAGGDAVLYQDHTSGMPLFRGWAMTPTASPYGIGRSWTVRCTGPEALLDWLITEADVTYALNSALVDAVQSLVVGTEGMPNPLRVFSGGRNSTQANPTADLGLVVGVTLDYAVTIPAGTTLREAIRMLVDATGGGAVKGSSPGPFCTVDMWFGLRLWGLNGGLVDYAGLSVNQVAGPIVPAALAHTVDQAGVPFAVFVKGGNAAGTGLVLRPTSGGVPAGPTPVLNDATILTAAARDAAGQAYLAERQSAVRGKLTRQTFVDTNTPAAHVSPGSDLTLVAAGIGVSGTYEIMQITRRFHGGNLETWDVAYGALPPSLPRAMRHFTRDILS